MSNESCSITIQYPDAIVTEHYDNYDDVTMARHATEKRLINTGYLWVSHGYFGGETLRNVWFRESDSSMVRIVIQCGKMIYP